MSEPLDENAPRLTRYSHGAGCGCKISPAVLGEILAGQWQAPSEALLVGNQGRDDAAAWDLGHGQVLLSTVDFFMPIVDDPFDFGRIASANALSDIWAMGGRPILALGVLGWPLAQLSPAVARSVVEGSRSLLAEAGVALAGGHSIDSPEPIFGLSVNGLVEKSRLKTNGGAKAGDRLYLTKPLGVGIYTTALKRAALRPEHRGLAEASMLRLNRIGEVLSGLPGVHALTDVTGFGLAGHLGEMAEASGLQAHLDLSALPVLPGALSYLSEEIFPGGTERNRASWAGRTRIPDLIAERLLFDPQTSGGLLVAVASSEAARIEDALREAGLGDFAHPIGELRPTQDEKNTSILSVSGILAGT